VIKLILNVAIELKKLFFRYIFYFIFSLVLSSIQAQNYINFIIPQTFFLFFSTACLFGCLKGRTMGEETLSPLEAV
jgi:hypothetical protein